MDRHRHAHRHLTRRHRPLPFAALAVAGLLGLVGCGSDDDASEPTTTTRADLTTTTAAASTTSSGDATTTTAAPAGAPVLVYFVRGEKVGVASRPGDDASPARAAMLGLLAGPTDGDRAAGLASAIPSGVDLLGLTIADGTATVDLSTEFGGGGGSLSMQERVAQVVHTLTQFPTVQRVVFWMAGAPVTALGGEGLLLDAPQTRDDWESMSPAILVESPAPEATASGTLALRGTSNTFEATFRYRVTDSTGEAVVDDFGTATSGTGTRGTFDVSIPLAGAAAGDGVLRVWEESAKDGSDINIVEIPIRIG